MDWSDERYVRVYTRKTAADFALTWQARAVWPLLLMECNRAGIIYVQDGPRRLRHLAGLLHMPEEVVAPAVEDLLGDGRLVVGDRGYVVPNFIEAQEATTSTAQRKRDERERKRDLAMEVTKRDPRSRNVTSRHKKAQNVTPSLAVPFSGGAAPLSRPVAPPSRPPEEFSGGGGSFGERANPTATAGPNGSPPKKAPPPPTEKTGGAGAHADQRTAAQAVRVTASKYGFALGETAFKRFQSHRRRAVGRLSESTPPDLAAWHSEALAALGGDGFRDPVASLDAAVDAFFRDPKPHWRLAGYPFAAFRSQWREYVPPEPHVDEAVDEAPPEWAGTEAGMVWTEVLDVLRAEHKAHTLQTFATLGVVPHEVADGCLVLRTTDHIGAGWMSTTYGAQLSELVSSLHVGLGLRIQAASTLRLVDGEVSPPNPGTGAPLRDTA